MIGEGGTRTAYLAGVDDATADTLIAVNGPGVRALTKYLASGDAVAFLGAGASAPLYPLWAGVLSELIDAAEERGLEHAKARTFRELAGEAPDAVVQQLRQLMGEGAYLAAMRHTFRIRRDPDTGRTWSPTHELVCRCPFRGVVTTNYDPGIVDARGKVRVRASGTGFSSWTDEIGLDDWLTSDIFDRDDELPILYAHGHHNQPDAIVLATTEYRRAYAGRLSRVLARLVESAHLVWVGFSFADARIGAVLREVAENAGTRINPGRSNRHVAVMPWDPASGRDPQALRALAEIQYGADLILYPAAGPDHNALQELLAMFTDAAYPPAGVLEPPTATLPQGRVPSGDDPTADLGVPAVWVPEVEVVAGFTGRGEELARLGRWAGDRSVRLVGVSAWGGAGKTALVTEWVRRGGAGNRSGVRGVFGWSFYADPSAEHWAKELLAWAKEALGVEVVAPGGGGLRAADAVLELLRGCPVVLVLDGLEVVQEGPGAEGGGGGFGRFLDGVLREVLTGACRVEHEGLVVLTSRFPFADLEGFDGGAARMLEVPAFTPAEGAVLLAALGAGWVDEQTRRGLAGDVDGHALALSALAGALADRSRAVDVVGLRADLVAAGRTDARVAKVLGFYADRLPERDRWLVAAVSLFAHPVSVDALRAVAEHQVFAGHLQGLTATDVRASAAGRLSGLVSWHPQGTLSAHPLVRDAFRPWAMGAADVAVEASLAGVPGEITTREDGLRVVEAIELLLDADQWDAADALYDSRTNTGQLWLSLPAARLGQRAPLAFVGTPTRRADCPNRLSPSVCSRYLGEVGLNALYAGDLATAAEYTQACIDDKRAASDEPNLSIALQNLTEVLGRMGLLDRAAVAAAEALRLAQAHHDRKVEGDAHTYAGWVANLAGDTSAAEVSFTAADRVVYANDPDGDHLYAMGGVWWGEFLARTGRTDASRRLNDANQRICTTHGWRQDLARVDRVRARLALVDGDPQRGLDRAMAAVAVLRDGELVSDLAETLPVLADVARAAGNLDAAYGYATEAVHLAGPRGLAPAQAAALTARAQVHAARATTAVPDQAQRAAHVDRARDDADAARSIAARHGLGWHELDALNLHTLLDEIDGTDNGWAAKAAALRKHLIPTGLEVDPLVAVEQLVAQDRSAANDDQERNES